MQAYFDIAKKSSLQMVFLLLAVLNASLFFPGLMSPDSIGYYSEARNHHYSDHNCPLLSYLWHYLNYIHDGSALMYLINIGMLWGSVYFLTFRIFKDTKYLKYLCLLIPFVPQVIVYAGWIWKDLVFSYGFGLLGMYLAAKSLQQKSIPWYATVLFIIGLIYFTAAKYQAQFVAPVLICWYFFVQNKCKFNWKVFAATIIGIICLVTTVDTIKSAIVNKHGKGSNYSWQYVKAFDIGGMSVFSGQNLMPSELLVRPDINVADIKKAYTLDWADLIHLEFAPFKHPANAEDREILLNAWYKAVFTHPISYLQHRYRIWSEGMLFASPGKAIVHQKLANYPRLDQIFTPLCTLTAFIYLIPFMVLSWVIVVRSWKHQQIKQYAQITGFLLTMGHVLLVVYFFKSLSASPRYIYFSVYMFMLSVPFTTFCAFNLLAIRKHITIIALAR